MALTQEVPPTVQSTINKINKINNIRATEREIIYYANKICDTSKIKLKVRYIRQFCEMYRHRPMGIELLRLLLEGRRAKYPKFSYNSNTHELIFVNLKIQI